MTYKNYWVRRASPETSHVCTRGKRLLAKLNLRRSFGGKFGGKFKKIIKFINNISISESLPLRHT